MNEHAPWPPQALDIVAILRFWESTDDVPDDLQPYLAIAADEIAGLRAENKYLRRILNDADRNGALP